MDGFVIQFRESKFLFSSGPPSAGPTVGSVMEGLCKVSAPVVKGGRRTSFEIENRSGEFGVQLFYIASFELSSDGERKPTLPRVKSQSQ